jgi:predicted GNAT family acetyltransferase
MPIERYRDPVAFLAAAEDLLLADEARHNLLLGLLGVLIAHPDLYPSFHLWLVGEEGRVVGAGLRTPPHLLVLATPRSPRAVEELSRAVVEEGMELPGVVGGLPEAEDFAALHGRHTGRGVSSRMEQAIYALEAVADVPTPPGTCRPAGPEDLERLVAWIRAFTLESTPEPWDEVEARRRLAYRLATAGASGYWLWEDGAAVCLVGFGNPTPSGIRIGPVYTPPSCRRRGYATGLVAAVSREMLARGRRSCFLYTDLANPTSNAIYPRIGYRRVCAAAMLRFA